MMNLISLCDGQKSLLEITESLKAPVWELYETIETLVNHELLEISEWVVSHSKEAKLDLSITNIGSQPWQAPLEMI